MKGAILPDHIPINKYKLIIPGLPPLTPTEIGGLEDELQTVDLPDRTKATGGNRGTVEFSISIPAHHLIERAAMEIWFQEGQDPVLPTYKKAGTLIITSLSGSQFASYTLPGLFIMKRATPDLELANEGEMMSIEYTMSSDDVIPI